MAQQEKNRLFTEWWQFWRSYKKNVISIFFKVNLYLLDDKVYIFRNFVRTSSWVIELFLSNDISYQVLKVLSKNWSLNHVPPVHILVIHPLRQAVQHLHGVDIGQLSRRYAIKKFYTSLIQSEREFCLKVGICLEKNLLFLDVGRRVDYSNLALLISFSISGFLIFVFCASIQVRVRSVWVFQTIFEVLFLRIRVGSVISDRGWNILPCANLGDCLVVRSTR